MQQSCFVSLVRMIDWEGTTDAVRLFDTRTPPNWL
jgi:hypothetical protein